MIKNERQYRITRAQAARFARTLESLRERGASPPGVHPRIAKAQEDAVRSQLADLEAELREYEETKAGAFPWDDLNTVAEVATLLIKARIALGLSQKELAARVGLKEQQIQRYEATDYATAKLSSIRRVADALAPGAAPAGEPGRSRRARN